MNKLKILYVTLALSVVCLFLIFGGLIYSLQPRAINFDKISPDKQRTIYLEQECKPVLCEDSLEIFDNSQDVQHSITAKVFGTIYEDVDTATIFGTCSDELNQPKETNATITIYYQNTSIFINQSNMSVIEQGKFNLSLIVNDRGNYLVQLNCTAGTQYAVAYTEFQNPNWVNKIQTALTQLTELVGRKPSKDFEIDKLIAVSPIYPNETMFVEATFSDENGTLIVPDELNLSILYPNRSNFTSSIKNDFMNTNSVWNYSKKLAASQATGTYYVRLWAYYNSKEAIKTAQFRVATGGPFLLRLDCNPTVQAGQALSCTVKIIDEGEVAVESTTITWIDTNGDGLLDATEPQVSFSIETSPQDQISQAVTINIPSSHQAGVFIARTKTSYLGSTQPDSTASDTITIIAGEAEGGVGGIGGGAGDGSLLSGKCNPYILAYNTCYYLDTINIRCVKGCPENYECSLGYTCQLMVNATIGLEPKVKPKLSLWERIKAFILSLFNVNPELGAMPIQPNPDAEEQPILRFISQPVTIALIIVGAVLLALAIWYFGMHFIFTNPYSLGSMALLLLTAYLLLKYRIFGG